jgi:hypothetical protein
MCIPISNQRAITEREQEVIAFLSTYLMGSHSAFEFLLTHYDYSELCWANVENFTLYYTEEYIILKIKFPGIFLPVYILSHGKMYTPLPRHTAVLKTHDCRKMKWLNTEARSMKGYFLASKKEHWKVTKNSLCTSIPMHTFTLSHEKVFKKQLKWRKLVETWVKTVVNK